MQNEATDPLARKLAKSICYELETVGEDTPAWQVLDSIAFAAIAAVSFMAEVHRVDERFYRVRLAEAIHEHARRQNESWG